ncbi:MAG: sensor histidine kinase [Actinobacteria bacterium]|nr:sensor histidine kinase [Actinomycetota bacterium]
MPATIGIAVWLQVPTWIAILSTTLATASALTLLAAQRWPGVTVAVVAALTAAQLFAPLAAEPPFIALGFAIISAVIRGARTWALISVGAAWLVAIATGGVLDVGWHPLRVAAATLGLALCFAIGEGIRSRFDLFQHRRSRIAEQRSTAEQDERTRIAQQLHNVLAHSLSRISAQSSVGLHVFDTDPERAREALTNIRELSATGLDEVRGVLAFLRGDDARSTDTAPLTTQPQLRDLPELVTRRTGLGLTVTLDDELHDDLPPRVVQATAYRIAQEALTNVVRHSAATEVTIVLDRDADDLVLTVIDDGVGVRNAAEGSGIRSMRDRARMLDGTVDFSTGVRTGTAVTARIPWAGPE